MENNFFENKDLQNKKNKEVYSPKIQEFYDKNLINTVIQGDCLDVMKTMPDKCIDLVLTDPPYGIGENPSRALGRAKKTNKWKNAKAIQYVGGNWDIQPDKIYFDEIKRISKNQIIWGGNYFTTKILLDTMGWLVWYKKGQNPNNDFSDCELAWTSFNKAVRYIDFPWTGFGAINAKEKRFHPTQKPVKVIKWALQYLAKSGDLIFDPFAGSGTTAIACIEMNLDYICVEKDPDYIKIINNRIQETKNKLKMSLF
jgi:site-specific DNA-methyltransferase (adenine-specific)